MRYIKSIGLNSNQQRGRGFNHPYDIAFSSDDLTKTEKDFASRPKVFKIGNYRNYDIKSFGGSISILFFAIKGLIVEFVAKRKNNE